MSFRQPRPTSNPYLSLLTAALRETGEVEPLYFSWRTALLGSYDVFHVQWPETLIAGSTWLRARVNELRYAALLARLAITRTPLIRTAHNVDTHTPATRVGRWLGRRTEGVAKHVIVLNEHTPVSASTGSTPVPHGHYRDWYTVTEETKPEPDRVLYFGLMRPYKGIDELLTAMASAPEAALDLRLVGSPADAVVADEVERAGKDDARISSHLAYIEDDDLTREIQSATLVVLPYKALHNSGALLLALSLDRPVLVPRNQITDELADEVGSIWVQRYDGQLSMAAIATAMAAVATVAGRPDLSEREWRVSGERHASAYRIALDRRDH